MLRLGLVCDFAEERWPSMDLVGEMLFEQLHRCHGDRIQVDRLRPAFRRIATASGLLQSSHTAWNGDRLWNRMVEYPRQLRKRPPGCDLAGYDLFHIVDHSYSHLTLTLPPGRTVVTCHDLETFRCLLEPERDPRPLWFRAMARRILDGFQSARHIIFVSETVRREADRLGVLHGSRNSVIPNGAFGDIVPDQDADLEADRLLGTGKLLLLSVGSTIPRKRIDVLLNVFAGIANVIPGVRLAHAGGALTEPQLELARRLGINGSIVELPFLSRAVLSAVYKRATLLLQPSDAEGFGLPVVEAMAYGCPVVASDLPVLREVGGEAAVYCPVGEICRWVETAIQLLQLCQREPVAWSILRRRSIENARRFSWRENAERVANTYHEVIAAMAPFCGSTSLSKSDASVASEVSAN